MTLLVLQHHRHIAKCSNSSGGDNVDADIIGVTAPPESLQLRPKWKSNVHQLGPLWIEHHPDDDYYRCGSDDMMMSKKYLHTKKTWLQRTAAEICEVEKWKLLAEWKFNVDMGAGATPLQGSVVRIKSDNGNVSFSKPGSFWANIRDRKVTLFWPGQISIDILWSWP